ncbi:MAG: hypothetical protein IT532_03785 [Burkholderiales bacterium]|nr:hypothetical protein [Burkholderiales bacterium]
MISSRPEDDSDELLGKLEHLLHRQEPGTPAARGEPVPLLTEAVEDEARAPEANVPVLLDAVESQQPQTSPPAVPLDQLRLLQAALYLRLRQSVDEALQDASLADLPATQRAQFAQALRRALPRIVRESVVQAFGYGEPSAESTTEPLPGFRLPPG